jgi:hypothetical protein
MGVAHGQHVVANNTTNGNTHKIVLILVFFFHF